MDSLRCDFPLMQKSATIDRDCIASSRKKLAAQEALSAIEAARKRRDDHITRVCDLIGRCVIKRLEFKPGDALARKSALALAAQLIARAQAPKGRKEDADGADVLLALTDKVLGFCSALTPLEKAIALATRELLSPPQLESSEILVCLIACVQQGTFRPEWLEAPIADCMGWMQEDGWRCIAEYAKVAGSPIREVAPDQPQVPVWNNSLVERGLVGKVSIGSRESKMHVLVEPPTPAAHLATFRRFLVFAAESAQARELARRLREARQVLAAGRSLATMLKLELPSGDQLDHELSAAQGKVLTVLEAVLRRKLPTRFDPGRIEAALMACRQGGNLDLNLLDDDAARVCAELTSSAWERFRLLDSNALRSYTPRTEPEAWRNCSQLEQAGLRARRLPAA